MRTTTDLLPAINSLYDLNLTEQDINELSTKLDSFVDKFNAAENKPKLTYDEDLKTLQYVIRRGNSLYYASNATRSTEKITIKKHGNSYDEAANTKALEKLDGMLKEGERGYIVSIHDRYSDRRFVIIKDLEMHKLKDLSYLQRFLSEVKESKVIFNDLYTKTYPKIDDFKDAIEADLWENYEHLKLASRDFETTHVKNFFKVVLPNAKLTTTDKRRELEQKCYESPRNSLRAITDIFEQNNVRFCITTGAGYYDGSTSGIITVHSDHASFDYADVNRYYLSDSSRYDGENSTSERPFGKAMFIAEDPIIPRKNVLQYMFDSINDETTRNIADSDVNLIVKRLAQQEAREQADQKRREALEKKVEDKIKVLNDPKGTLKLNNVHFTHGAITYAEQTLSFSNRTGWVGQMVSRLTRHYQLNDINYDHVFDYFIDIAAASGDIQGTIGTVDFNIELVTKVNIRNISSTRYYVNGSRVNKDEIKPVLTRAICFDKQEDFDYFVKSVGSCSLKMHRYLQTGIDIDVRDDFDGSNCVMKLPIERRKNINYLVLNDQEYRIRDTQKVIGLQKKYQLLDIINALLTDTVIVGVVAEDIKELIEAAKKEYITAVEKSKQLLKETEDLFKIKLDTVRFQDGKERHGYVINGNLRTYFLEFTEREEDRAGVYSYPDGRYICIVDKSQSQVGMDKLVNRIYALHNDSLVASQINTLQT